MDVLSVITEGIAMVKGGKERLKIWLNKHVNYRGARKQSDYRAMQRAQRLGYFDGVASCKLTGDPAARGEA